MPIAIATVDGGRTSVDESALDQFAASIRGELLKPGDSRYSEKPVYNAMAADRRPALIVRCTGTADVVDAVKFARQHNLLVAVRGGGHSVAGHSTCDNGIVIDLTRMRGVEVDPESRIARVQGGALWGDVDRETQAFGLVVPGGVVSETGVAGLTLGGGEGWVRRKYGLTIDSLLSARVVCADGSVRTASAKSEVDLFWALPRAPRRSFNQIAPYSTGTTYTNFTGQADESAVTLASTAYGANMARLSVIKAKYDPDNFFRLNANISPAATARA